MLLGLFTSFSLIAVFIILLFVGIGMYKIYYSYSINHSENMAINITKLIFEREKELFFYSVPGKPDVLSVEPEDIAELDRRLHYYLNPLDIVKVKVISNTGRIVYSTDHSIIGVMDSDNKNLQRALSGDIISELEGKEKVWDLEEEQRLNIDLVETYLPLKNNNNEIVGAIEIYVDITNAKGNIQDILISTLAFIAFIIFSAFGILYLLMRNGTKQLVKQEEALQSSEEKFRSVTDHASDVIICCDSSGNISYINSACIIFGYSPDELLGNPATTLMPERFHQSHTNAMQRVTQTGKTTIIGKTVEFTGRKKDGTEFPIDTSLSTWKINNKPYFTAIVRDITERKQKEEEVRKFKTISDKAGYGVSIINLQGNIEYVNDAFASMHNHSHDSLIKNNISALYEEKEYSRVNNLLQHLNNNGPLINEEVWHKRKDGTTFPALVNASIISNQDGTPINIASTTLDITDRKEAEETTNKRLQYLKALRSIDKAITASLDLNVTLEILLDKVTSELHVDAATILLHNQHTHLLEYAISKDFRSDALKYTKLKLGESNAGRAAIERKIITINNLNEDINGFSRSADFATERFVCYFAVPLIAKGQVKGVLELFSRTQLNADPEWMDFLDGIASQAAIAIDNASLFSDLERSNTELVLAYDATIEGWSRALDMRDKETEGHCQRVTDMTLQVAQKFNVKDQELVHIRRGALLHDIGKMGIPDKILHKPGKLDEEEWAIMKRHPEYAYNFLDSADYLKPALDIPYCHHEKWDGNGYPRGLKGTEIPLSARIFSIVDVWDALSSDRPYRPAWPQAKVTDYIKSLSGIQFDPQVVDAFFSIDWMSDVSGNLGTA